MPEKNKNYEVYTFGDSLTHGRSFKIEHDIVCENTEIPFLIAKGEETLQAIRQSSVQDENKAYEIVLAAVKQWEQQAVLTQAVDRALAYLHTPEVTHTGNKWQKSNSYRADKEISNRVYRMSCSVLEDTKYDRNTEQKIPVAWYVTWEVEINSPKKGFGCKIAGQTDKRYTDKAAAIKYLEGRKKAYSHLFAEISPPIPQKYEQHFMVNDVLLPGYKIEGQELFTDRQTTIAENDGIPTSLKEPKTSVLEKLLTAKEQSISVKKISVKDKDTIHR